MPNFNTYISVQREWNAGWGFNNTLTLTFTLNGSAFDISTYVFALGVRRIGGGANVMSLTQSSGITNGGATGILTIQITKAQTELIDADSYFYTLNYTKSSLLYSLLHGTFNLLDDYNPDEIDNSVTIEANLAGVTLDLEVTLAGGSGTSIQFQDEGVDLGNDQADTIDFVGAGVTATRTLDKITVNIPGDTSSGTVTSVAVGGIGGLFTTDVQNPNTDVDVSFTLDVQGANSVFAGPLTGSPAAPTFRALVADDIPALPYAPISGSANYWKTAGTSTITSDYAINQGAFNGNISFDDNKLFEIVSGQFASTEEFRMGVGGGDSFFSYTSADLSVFRSIAVGNTGIAIQDDSGLGAVYAADYSLTFIDRSLVDKGYVLGAKTYTGIQTFSLTSLYSNNTGIDVVATGGSDILNVGTSNADVINIGYSGSTINIQGTLVYQNVTNLQVKDKLVTYNKGGAAASGSSSGFEIEENAMITGWFTTNGTRDGWDFKAPAITGVATLSLASLTGNHTYTLPDANGTFAVSASGNIALSAAGNITFTGDLPFSNLTQGSARSVLGVTGNATADVASIQGSTDQVLRVDNAGTGLSFGSIDLSKSATVGTSILPEANGGTNFSSYTTGDLIQASAAGTLAKLNSVATGNVLISGGVATISSWGKVTSSHIDATVQTSGLSWLLASGGALTANNTISGAFTATFTNTNTKFNSGVLQVRNPANTFDYTFVGSALAATRNATLPLLTGDDTFVFESHTQTLNNKTMGTAGFWVFNPAATFKYNIVGSAIAANRQILLPVLSADAFAMCIAGATGNNLIPFQSATGVYAHSANLNFTTNRLSGTTLYLTVSAGTTTAGTCPIVMTSGTNLTTAISGGIEYNNTFHMTNSDATRRHVVLCASATKTTAGAPYANSGYVVMNIGGTDFNVMVTG